MSAAQSFKNYEVLGRHFGNSEDAKTVVTEIEQITATKISDEKDVLATKVDLLQLQIDIEKRFNQLTIWIVGTLLGLAGIVIALARLK